jgi:hypothetical protein
MIYRFYPAHWEFLSFAEKFKALSMGELLDQGEDRQSLSPGLEAANSDLEVCSSWDYAGTAAFP